MLKCAWCDREIVGESLADFGDEQFCSTKCYVARYAAYAARIEYARRVSGPYEWRLTWRCPVCGQDRHVLPHQADEVDAIDELKQALANPRQWARHECAACERSRLRYEDREHTARSS